MPYSQSSLSQEYVHVRVRDAIAGADPTGDTVQMAFVPTPYANPSGGDWKSASWYTDASDPARPVYYARCLVGPSGTVALPPGTYRLWLKLTDAPEVPARPVADITIT